MAAAFCRGKGTHTVRVERDGAGRAARRFDGRCRSRRKSIIDIGVAVTSSADVATCVASLGQLGNEYLGDRQGTGEHFFAKGDDSSRTHYLHAVAHDSQQWADYLRFRARLRADPALRDEYARRKYILTAARASYT